MEHDFTDMPDGELTRNASARYARGMDETGEEVRPPEERPPRAETPPRNAAGRNRPRADRAREEPQYIATTPEEATRRVEERARQQGRPVTENERRAAARGLVEVQVQQQRREQQSPPTQEQQPQQQRQRARGGGERFNQQRNDLLRQVDEAATKVNALEEYRNLISDRKNNSFILSNISNIYDRVQQNDFQTQFEAIRKLLEDDNTDPELIRSQLREFIEETSTTAKEGRGKLPDNIYELADGMVQIADPKYGRGGKYEIVTREGDLNTINFLRLVRERMKDLHNNDPDNPIDFYSRIGIETNIRAISIGQLITLKDKIFRDRDNKKSEEIDDLYNALYYELWVFNHSRNNDADYRKVWKSDDKLPQALEAMYQKDTLAKGDALGRILTMSGQKEGLTPKEQLKDKGTGKGLREALLLYYYISDREMLEKIAGEDSFLFKNKITRDGIKKEMQNGVYIKALEEWDEGVDPELDPKLVTKEEDKKFKPIRTDFFDSEGNVIPEMMDTEYMVQLNLFNDINKSQDEVGETRERIKQHLMEKYGLTYFDADYAELFAYSMTRWTGISARNDTGKDTDPAVGFDAWGKVLNTRAYRKRQLKAAGQSGDKYTVFGIKKLGVTFWEGVQLEERHNSGKAERGKTLLEMLLNADPKKGLAEIMEQGSIDLRNAPELDRNNIKLETRAMEQYASNQIVNSFNMFHHVLEAHGMNFDKFITYDHHGHIKFDQTAADKIWDGIRKYLHYAYGSSGKLPLDHIVRYWETDNHSNKIVYKEGTVAESLFDKDVLSMMGEDVSVLDKPIESLNAKEKKERENVLKMVNKKVFLYLISTEMYAHRDNHSPETKYTFGQFEKIYSFLEQFVGGEVDALVLEPRKIDKLMLKVRSWFISREQAEKERDKLDESLSFDSTHAHHHYFKKKELDVVRRKSHTEFVPMFAQAIAGDSIIGGFKGLGDGIKLIIDFARAA